MSPAFFIRCALAVGAVLGPAAAGWAGGPQGRGPASAGARQPPELAITVAAPAAPLGPGGVALLVVEAPHDLTSLRGVAWERPVQFWRAGDGRAWQGLAGVPLDTRAGRHAVSVTGTGEGGRTVAGRTSLQVVAREFATRRLTVDPQMAEPPAALADRIAREARLMAETFALVTPERLWRGAFATPVPGTATSSFGRLTVTNGKPSGRHQGADFRAATGTTVRAPNAGRVAVAQDLYFAGNTVILDHGLGVFSLLAHLSRIDVAVGDRVARGAPLGASGATGRVTGPHLHWAVRFGDTSVDPLALVAAAASVAETAAVATR